MNYELLPSFTRSPPHPFPPPPPSPPHPSTPSPLHPLTPSPCHPLTLSPPHRVTPSPRRPFICDLQRIVVAIHQACEAGDHRRGHAIVQVVLTVYDLAIDIDRHQE